MFPPVPVVAGPAIIVQILVAAGLSALALMAYRNLVADQAAPQKELIEQIERWLDARRRGSKRPAAPAPFGMEPRPRLEDKAKKDLLEQTDRFIDEYIEPRPRPFPLPRPTGRKETDDADESLTSFLERRRGRRRRGKQEEFIPFVN